MQLLGKLLHGWVPSSTGLLDWVLTVPFESTIASITISVARGQLEGSTQLCYGCWVTVQMIAHV